MEQQKFCIIRSILKINGRNNHFMTISGNRTISEIKEQFCQEQNLDTCSVILIFNGNEVDYSSTYDDLELSKNGPLIMTFNNFGKLIKRAK